MMRQPVTSAMSSAVGWRPRWNRRQAVAIAAVAAMVALACLEPRAATRSFVWKASSKQGGTIYLAGSVHLLTPAYYPLSPAFDKAFTASDLLVLEIDMAEMLAPQSQMTMLTRGMLPADGSLEKVVSAETYAAVSAKVAELGLPLSPLNRFKPWALALTLQALEWQKAGFDTDLGLDKHFFDLAVAARKPVQGLETLAYQISRFDEMSADGQDRLLAQTLKELETTKASFTTLADAWKSGDSGTVEDIVLQDLKSEPQMYQRLLVERNRAWLPKIEALFTRPAPAFVVVGAAHLVGADGLLQMLRSKGYTLEQL
jgi:uncharacterized protein YbaP (TraB family)